MDTRLIQLLARKLSGERMAGETAALDDLLFRDPEGVYYAELISQLWKEEMAGVPADMDLAYAEHIAHHRPGFNDPVL